MPQSKSRHLEALPPAENHLQTPRMPEYFSELDGEKAAKFEMLLKTEQKEIEHLTRLGEQLRSGSDSLWDQFKKGLWGFLERTLFRDEVTQLANLRHLLLTLSLDVNRARQNHHNFFVLVASVDNFDNITHALGYSRGDQVLKEIARRLEKFSMGKGRLAKTGSCEFTIVFFGNMDEISNFIQDLKDVLSPPVTLDNQEINITVCIGISAYPKDAKDATGLLNCARKAMTEAKTIGQDEVQFYSKNLFKKSYLLVKMKKDLEIAFEKEQFTLFHQPKICLKKRTIVGLEALLRWVHPEKGIVPPMEFIPTLEATGLIDNVGKWVIEECCKHLKETFTEGFSNITIAFNVSPKQFKQKKFSEDLIEIVESNSIEPGRLRLEITESALMTDVADAIRKLDKIRSFGMGISIDDFGTGYSSLAYLKKIPASALKIDMSFVKALPGNRDDVEIVKAIISLANSLGKKTVAEGVETKEQLSLLMEMGVDEAQGYYFSKPLPLGECSSYLRGYERARYF